MTNRELDAALDELAQAARETVWTAADSMSITLGNSTAVKMAQRKADAADRVERCKARIRGMANNGSTEPDGG